MKRPLQMPHVAVRKTDDFSLMFFTFHGGAHPASLGFLMSWILSFYFAGSCRKRVAMWQYGFCSTAGEDGRTQVGMSAKKGRR